MQRLQPKNLLRELHITTREHDQQASKATRGGIVASCRRNVDPAIAHMSHNRVSTLRLTSSVVMSSTASNSTHLRTTTLNVARRLKHRAQSTSFDEFMCFEMEDVQCAPGPQAELHLLSTKDNARGDQSRHISGPMYKDNDRTE